ncbi:MAG TPA: glycine cleavage system aminomethyltransferase GcvT [Conexibacter sp.]|nr:glycine cleavage system aminomethyltransferase GcvT [Conexibacter sp.]
MVAAASETLRRTPLHDRHVAAGARLVPFAGWEMPVQYVGVREEHLAVREHAGVFDVSHMGEIGVRGPGARDFLQRMLSNDVSAIDVGGAQYSVLCREDGGVLDDLFAYRIADEGFLMVTNAANHANDLAWLRAHADGHELELIDRLDAFAMLAVQGPAARELVAPLADGPLPARFHTASLTVAGARSLVCGTGYTGEDGVELLCFPGDVGALWDALLAAGVVPAGLAARDTLRLEACYPLYGNDLMESRGPIEAGLGWCCKEATGFVGSDAVAAARNPDPAHPAERLVPFAFSGPGIPRQGNAVVGGGEVTSGTLSPCRGVGIGMAYVPAERAAVGTEIEIDVRGKLRSAVIEDKPLYRKDR